MMSSGAFKARETSNPTGTPPRGVPTILKEHLCVGHVRPPFAVTLCGISDGRCAARVYLRSLRLIRRGYKNIASTGSYTRRMPRTRARRRKDDGSQRDPL